MGPCALVHRYPTSFGSYFLPVALLGLGRYSLCWEKRLHIRLDRDHLLGKGAYEKRSVTAMFRVMYPALVLCSSTVMVEPSWRFRTDFSNCQSVGGSAVAVVCQQLSTLLIPCRLFFKLDFPSSATTLVSDRNTRVFRTALTPLTEHRTLWRRNTCYPSPKRRVALHTYLLYCLVTYTHHQNDTCVTLCAVAAVMLKPFTQRLAMLNAWRWLCLSPAAASLGMQLVRLEIIATTYGSTIFKTYAFSLYSHLCIYIATYLHLRYPWISVHPPSIINDVLGGRDRASL